MRAGADGQANSAPSSSSNNNNNNNVSSENSGNSGSQYALCALGVGLVALGIVMIVWSVVPADPSANNTSAGDSETGSRKNKASSVAFVLVGSGVVMLLLSLCLGMRNKQREQMRLLEAQSNGAASPREQERRETAEEQAQRYAVPTYEEAVGSGQYPVSQSNLEPGASQLPSYDDLVKVDGVQFESEVPEVAPPSTQPGPATGGAPSTSNRRAAKNSRKLLPIKIRRIKSEKMPAKSGDTPQPAAALSIEPLTPPPQYEDKVPPL
ncbi:transmembrane protein 51a [Synchiropus picturatus]